jgi:hypothetical protein
MLRPIQCIAGFILLLAVEILRVYFIMPVPGSQESESVEIAYFLHNNIVYFRIIGVLLIAFPVIHYYMFGKLWKKVLVTVGLIAYVYIFIMFNYRFSADKMFIQPQNQ